MTILFSCFSQEVGRGDQDGTFQKAKSVTFNESHSSIRCDKWQIHLSEC